MADAVTFKMIYRPGALKDGKSDLQMGGLILNVVILISPAVAARSYLPKEIFSTHFVLRTHGRHNGRPALFFQRPFPPRGKMEYSALERPRRTFRWSGLEQLPTTRSHMR